MRACFRPSRPGPGRATGRTRWTQGLAPANAPEPAPLRAPASSRWARPRACLRGRNLPLHAAAALPRASSKSRPASPSAPTVLQGQRQIGRVLPYPDHTMPMASGHGRCAVRCRQSPGTAVLAEGGARAVPGARGPTVAGEEARVWTPSTLRAARAGRAGRMQAPRRGKRLRLQSTGFPATA